MAINSSLTNTFGCLDLAPHILFQKPTFINKFLKFTLLKLGPTELFHYFYSHYLINM